MSRLVVALVALFFYLSAVAAAPIPVAYIEKRVTHEGRGTWYYTGLGNCGWENNDNDKIVAIAKSRYDAENGSNCGQWMQIVNKSNGRSVMARTVDSCESCTYNDIDMSPSAFNAISSLDVGQITVDWHS
ncbi:RlpA-like double-psi beta-barrel-protein domain-containing protein-containing protein [Mucidula mucida]|nr:RlpA-like double-psi beta-barrel-protein domain-containing protein-containing protein [Mucidula mucida]